MKYFINSTIVWTALIFSTWAIKVVSEDIPGPSDVVVAEKPVEVKTASVAEHKESKTSWLDRFRESFSDAQEAAENVKEVEEENSGGSEENLGKLEEVGPALTESQKTTSSKSAESQIPVVKDSSKIRVFQDPKEQPQETSHFLEQKKQDRVVAISEESSKNSTITIDRDAYDILLYHHSQVQHELARMVERLEIYCFPPAQ